MMINCPKCGFSQPKDRYCARCGVDMVTYQPAEPTLSDRLKSNWIIQIAVFALILIGGYMYYREHSVPTLEERIASIEEAPQSRAIEDLTPQSEQAQTVTVNPEQPQPQAPVPSVPAESADPNLIAKPDGGSASGASEPQPSSVAAADTGRGFMHATDETLNDQPANNRSDTAVTVQRLKIRFAEILQPFANELANNTRNLAQYDNFKGGTVSDMLARLQEANRLRLIRDLDSANESPVRINQPIIAFKGTRDEATESNLGLTVQLTPVSRDEQGVQLQIEVLRNLREPGSPTPVERTYQETFVVPKNGGIFLNGILPRRQLDADEARVYAASPVLRVMASPPFQSGERDFVIIIEAR